MTEPQTSEIETLSGFEIFQRNLQSLARATSRVSSVYDQLGMESRAQALAVLKKRLESDGFKVMVLGEFKRGKSTFINALLGEEVLPASVVPCTAVINEIKWGEEKRAVLHFRHPQPAVPGVKLPREVAAHIRRGNGGPVPPLEVPVASLDTFVAIPDPGREQADSIAESPYARVEVSWPLELCRQGIEIIDSPGLNENVTRARVAKDYVANVDAILFVMSCDALGAESELRVIDQELRGVGHEYLFFICNRFDQIRPADRPRLVEYAKKKLGGRTALQDGIFFLSALQGLDARRRDDDALLESSGLAGLERELTRFLTEDRAKVKLLQPARELSFALSEARDKILPAQRAALDVSLATLEARVEELSPRLADAERSKRQIVANINHHRQSLQSEVRLEAERFLRDIADSLETWVDELDLESTVSLFKLKHEEQIEAMAKEICTKVGVKVEEEAVEWSQQTLQPLVEKRLEAMAEDASVRVSDFCSRIDEIRTAFSKVELRENEELKDASGGQRLIAAVGGLLLGDVFSMAHGARFGFKGLASSILAQAATFGLLYGVLGIANPFVLIPALLGAGAATAWLRTGAITGKAKKEIARSLTEQFRSELGSTAQKIADEVHEGTQEFVSTAEEGLDREIKSLREQMDSVLSDKKAGEVQVQAKKRLLADLDGELRDVDGVITELIFAVAGRPRTACAM